MRNILPVIPIIVANLFFLLIIMRGDKVQRYRRMILDQVSAISTYRIEEGLPDWNNLYQYFDKVSFTKMLFQFWKPLDSFKLQEAVKDFEIAYKWKHARALELAQLALKH